LENAALYESQKNSKEQVKASLKEKEILLKEIHHRVKNNMQIISSLLNLQADQVKDPEDIELFYSSQRRIRTMAIVHEKLYQSKDFSSIDFGDYISDLMDYLSHSFSSHNKNINISLNCESLYLKIDSAIPCALIIQELVSNSFEHAFIEKKSGNIQISLIRDQAGFCNLTIKDDGIGVPESFNLKKTGTLGLHLVELLCQQINGSIAQ